MSVRADDALPVGVRRLWSSPPRVVAAATAATAALHLLFLRADLAPDEGGYLEVARQWDVAGPTLYGRLWVDRPPGLLVLFHAAGAMGVDGVRLTAALASAVLVLAAGWAGWSAAGAGGARWSAVVAAALSGSQLLGAKELDGELLAAPLVMLSAALLLHALRPAITWWPRVVCAVGAGAAATYAVLVKQNFVDGLAFGGVLLLAHLPAGRGGRRARGDVLALGGAAALGAAGVVGALLLWAERHDRLAQLWYAMYGFRLDATRVLETGPLTAPERRLVELLALGLLGGVLYLAAGAVAGLRRDAVRGSPVAVAVLSGLAVEAVGVSLGASYWPHYLIQLVPMVALGCGVVAARSGRGPAALRALCVLAAATTLVASPAMAVHEYTHGSDADRVGGWVRESAREGDTVVVTYSHPNVLHASGLTTPYRYAWSLPVRTLDPRLTILAAVLRGPRAPTWLVQWDPFDRWGLDPHGRLAALVHRRYHRVATPCGHPVWLRDATVRPLAGPPTGCDPAFGEG